MPLNFIKIASTTLTTDTANITFSSIPTGYTDLLIFASVRNAINSSTWPYRVLLGQFNGDTTSTNYDNHRTYAISDGTSYIEQNNNDGMVRMVSSTGDYTIAGHYSHSSAYIAGYQKSHYKTIISSYAVDWYGQLLSGGYANHGIFSTIWKSTSAITSIKIADPSGYNLIAGSKISLYGVP